MNGKSLLMLGLAIGVGLIAMFLTRQMLGQESPRNEDEARDVLVAARDLKEEELLKPDAVKVVRMVRSAVPAGAFSTAKDVEERWVKTAMLEGDVVIEKKLGPKGTPPGLVANIPKGMRAFAIDVTEQSGVSGFILPGHRVDVIRVESDKDLSHGESILQDILVLAAGQVFTRADERALTTRTVTLAVTPDQVNVLVAARSRGSLSLSLRGVNDHEVVVKPVEAKPVLVDVESRLKEEQQARRRVEDELRALKSALAARTTDEASRQRPRRLSIYRGPPRRDRGHVEEVALDGSRTHSIAARQTNLEPADDPFARPVGPVPPGAAASGAAVRQAANKLLGPDVAALPANETPMPIP